MDLASCIILYKCMTGSAFVIGFVYCWLCKAIMRRYFVGWYDLIRHSNCNNVLGAP